MPEPQMYRTIYGVCKEQSVDNDMLHEIVQTRFAKASLKELTERECHLLLDGLRGKQKRYGSSGHKNTARGQAMQQAGRKGYADSTVHLVNEREMQMLREAAELRGWDILRLAGFIRRQIGSEKVHTMQEFNKVFWPLKRMNARDGLTKGGNR